MKDFKMASIVNHNLFYSKNGMMASSHPLASIIGLNIIEKGGSAIDAAIAANAILSFLKPYACGPGGDLAALVWSNTSKESFSCIFPSGIPDSLKKESLLTRGLEEIPENGALPLGVPGSIYGWHLLHKAFGKLPLPELFAPVIKYAFDGYPVSEETAIEWKPLEDKLMLWDASSKIFLRGDRTPNSGELFRNPCLAYFFQLLSEKGLEHFYQGEISDLILNVSSEYNGFLKKTDFIKYASLGKLANLFPSMNPDNNMLFCLNMNKASENGVFISSVDKSKNAVTLVQTLNKPFGSGLVIEKYGFALGNPFAGLEISDIDRIHDRFFFPGVLYLLIDKSGRIEIGYNCERFNQTMQIGESYPHEGLFSFILDDSGLEEFYNLNKSHFIQVNFQHGILKGILHTSKEMSLIGY
jgi:gamma-glutamyltranspeptidase